VGVEGLDLYRAFADKALRTQEELTENVAALKRDGKSLAAYGAAAKGSTLLNFCGLTAEDIAFVADRSPHKVGRLMPGSRVPIVDADELARRVPDVALLLAWNFAEEIIAQQSGYVESGGQFLVPVPEVRLLGKPAKVEA